MRAPGAPPAVVALAAALAVLNSHASVPLARRECSEVAPLHNPALHGRRKDQGKTNFCFPFALGHVLSVATGREVNPLDIVRKLSEDGSVDWGVGIPYPMVGRGLEIAQRGGVCAGGIGPVSGPLMEAYSEACRRDRTTRSADSGGTRPHGPPGAANPAGDAEGILGQLMAETERDCEGRRRESVFWPVYMGFAPPAEPLNVEFSAAMGRADALLDAGMPLMLAFNARMLGGPSSKNHVVAVIGRRKNPLTGECQYLLLDSNSDSTCGDYIAEGGEGDCDKGHVWVPERLIGIHGSSLSGYGTPLVDGFGE